MDQFSDVMNMIVFITVVPCISAACSGLVLIETVYFEFSHFAQIWIWNFSFWFQFGSQLYEVAFPFLGVILALELLFAVFCFGQMLHSTLIDLNDLIYQSQWYKHPRVVQRCLLLMLTRAQKPFYISAYGFMRCDLGNFVGVSGHALSIICFSFAFLHLLYWSML